MFNHFYDLFVCTYIAFSINHTQQHKRQQQAETTHSGLSCEIVIITFIVLVYQRESPRIFVSVFHTNSFFFDLDSVVRPRIGKLTSHKHTRAHARAWTFNSHKVRKMRIKIRLSRTRNVQCFREFSSLSSCVALYTLAARALVSSKRSERLRAPSALRAVFHCPICPQLIKIALFKMDHFHSLI